VLSTQRTKRAGSQQEGTLTVYYLLDRDSNTTELVGGEEGGQVGIIKFAYLIIVPRGLEEDDRRFLGGREGGRNLWGGGLLIE